MSLATTAQRAEPERLQRDPQRGVAWLMSAPFLIIYALFLIIPIAYALVLSFTDASLVKPGLNGFAGVANYVETLTSSDFWASVWHTVLFTVFTTPPLVVIPLLLAILAERLGHARWIWRTVFYMPNIMPSAVVSLFFGWIYAGNGTGILNQYLHTDINWLGDPNWAMASVVILTVWWTSGFNYLLYSAALQDIPQDVYEAAAVDGALPLSQIFRITIPLLSGTTLLVVILQIIASLKVFDQIYILLYGGPDYATRPALEYIYDLGFTDYRIGASSAATVIIFVFILAIAFGWQRLTARRA